MTTTSDEAWLALQIIDIVEPFLAGHPPAVQSTILADLLARWVAGHHPLLRERMLTDHVELVKKLVPLCEQAQFGDAGHPGRKEMEEK